MAILAIAKDLKDLRQRMGKIIVAYDRDGNPGDHRRSREVDGAMTAWMGGSHQPEPYPDHRRPARVRTRRAVRRHRAELGHRGPSALSERNTMLLESGFGADIGYEKF